MLYHITRNGQNYGPYTLEDLQRYVASGNILTTDLAKSDDMPAWIPVSQVLGVAIPHEIPPSYANPQTPGFPAAGLSPYPDSPNLSWGLVLLFSFFTCTLFMWVWNLVLSSWMKRVEPASKAMLLYVAATVLLICQAIFSTHTNIMTYQAGMHFGANYYSGHPVTSLLGIGVWVVRLVARFTMRSELEHHFNTAEPVGLSLSGVMTFFFGGIYFQYHLNRINEMKRLARYRGAAI